MDFGKLLHFLIFYTFLVRKKIPDFAAVVGDLVFAIRRKAAALSPKGTRYANAIAVRKSMFPQNTHPSTITEAEDINKVQNYR